jgi:hypothetical protein
MQRLLHLHDDAENRRGGGSIAAYRAAHSLNAVYHLNRKTIQCHLMDLVTKMDRSCLLSFLLQPALPLVNSSHCSAICIAELANNTYSFRQKLSLHVYYR